MYCSLTFTRYSVILISSNTYQVLCLCHYLLCILKAYCPPLLFHVQFIIVILSFMLVNTCIRYLEIHFLVKCSITFVLVV
jgi:hypothetical protein